MKEKSLNEKKIAFIISVNNDLYYEECAWYINQLNMPDGYEKEILAIRDAKSMPEAYNLAMESTDAKYKVYMHQDTFIYYKEFVKEIINTFQLDEKLGLLGMIGGVDLPKNAIIYNAWNRGCTYACSHKGSLCIRKYQEQQQQYTEVEAVDGMLMATQYDIPWREDLNLGWDFYDISQSLEFRRKGYKVGIPTQQEPWCMHDCGYSKLVNYDAAREKIVREYQEFFRDFSGVVCNQELVLIEEQIFSKIKECIEQKQFEQAVQIKRMVDMEKITDNNLIYAWIMLEIYEKENKKAEENGSFFYGVNSWEQAKDKCILIGFMLRYVENEINAVKVQELKELIAAGTVSYVAVCTIALLFTYDYKKVIDVLSGNV